MLNSIRECCLSFLDKLPPSELPFVPALIMGILCSLVFILLLYKKHYRDTYWNSLLYMMRDIFISVPSANHSEFMKCNIETCVRCQKEDNVRVSVVELWKTLKTTNKEVEYPRIYDSVQRLSSIANSDAEDFTSMGSLKKGNFYAEQKPTIYEMNLPANPDWTNLDCYEMEKELLKLNFKVIKEEFAQIFKVFESGDTYGWKLNYIPSGHWCIFPLIDQGIVNEENVEKCPNTSALIGSFPGLMKDCVFGNACFSLLYPDSIIEPHYGPSNIRLRCHFGVSIPGKCWLEVNGSQLQWKEGESIIFDDSFLHSACFPSNRGSPAIPRVVLLLDFWHPSISMKERSVLLQILRKE